MSRLIMVDLLVNRPGLNAQIKTVGNEGKLKQSQQHYPRVFYFAPSTQNIPSIRPASLGSKLWIIKRLIVISKNSSIKEEATNYLLYSTLTVIIFFAHYLPGDKKLLRLHVCSSLKVALLLLAARIDIVDVFEALQQIHSSKLLFHLLD